MKPLIIIDVPNLSYRNHYALSGKSEFKLPIAFGLLRDLNTLAAHLHSTDFVFCFDHAHCARKDVYPNYKINRQNNPETKKIREQIEELWADILPMIGYQNLLHVDGAEADDLMALACHSTSRECYLVSNDTDLYQLLDDQVRIWNLSIRASFTHNDFVSRYKIRPKQWAHLKAIMGCDSDSIEGVDGVGIVTATKHLLGELSHASSRFSKIMESGGTIARNMDLIKLPYHGIKWEKPKILKDEINPDVWNSACLKYGLVPLVGRHPK